MGLHTPFFYIGYELVMANTIVYLLDHFCTGCHTDEDFCKGCHECPIGNLIFSAKDYIKGCETKDSSFLAMKKELERIRPYPHINCNWILQKERSADILIKLRELIKDLEFKEDLRIHPITLKNEKLRQIYSELEKQYGKK